MSAKATDVRRINLVILTTACVLIRIEQKTSKMKNCIEESVKRVGKVITHDEGDGWPARGSSSDVGREL